MITGDGVFGIELQIFFGGGALGRRHLVGIEQAMAGANSADVIADVIGRN